MNLQQYCECAGLTVLGASVAFWAISPAALRPSTTFELYGCRVPTAYKPIRIDDPGGFLNT